MARERMAKLLKYDHFEAISCHILTYFYDMSKIHAHQKTLSGGYVEPLAFR